MIKRPAHVIWITTDHMRADCIGAWGNPAMHTPNLDRLAAGGVNFRSCFSQNPFCMPSRASFMTGLYPCQTQLTSNGQSLRPDFPLTAPRLLKAGGFAAAQIGKLHLQPHEEMDLDSRGRSDFGFDVFWLSEEPGCYEDAYSRYLRSHFPRYERDFALGRPLWPGRDDDRIDRPIVDAPWQASHSGFVGCQTDRYLAAHLGSGPQFVHMGFYAPHPPLNPTAEMFAPYARESLPGPQVAPEEWADKPQPLATWLRRWGGWSVQQFTEYRRRFYAMVTGVDLAVGLLLDRLESAGVLDDTLIVFTSDHGDQCGDHGLLSKSPWFYDQTMNVPLIMHWPAGLGTARRDVSGLVEMVDLLPTMLELCHLGSPVPLSGRSWATELLAGQTPTGRDSVLAVADPQSLMLRTDRWKYIRYNATGGEVLYDLSASPSETTNLAADPASATQLAAMRQLALERLLQASRSPWPARMLY